MNQQGDKSDLAPVSAVIVAYNEELNIEHCLKSVAGWCGEILVVDSGSTDRTREICRSYGALIYSHAYVDHASQWDWALKNLPILNDWILPLDADHVVSERLRDQIIKTCGGKETAVVAYYSRHQYFFHDVSMRGFKRWNLRLFRRSRTVIDISELVDWRFVVSGETGKLDAVLYEHNRKEDDIDFWIDKHQKFSTRLAAEEVLRASGRIGWALQPKLFGSVDQKIIWLKNAWLRMPLYLRPLLYFAYRYFVRLGILDGTVGFAYHFLQAFWFRLVVDMKIAALRRQLQRGEVTLDVLFDLFAQRR